MVELQEVINNHDIVLIDGSLKGGEGLCRKLYDNVNYGQLNIDSIQEVISNTEGFKRILENSNVFTIPEIVEERKKFVEILGERLSFFNQSDKKHIPRGKRMRNKKRETFKPKESLETLQRKAYKTYCLLKKNSIKIKNPESKLLLDLIKTIEPPLKLKKDIGYSIGERDTNIAHESDTDERLVSRAYWYSLFTNESTCILTADKDIWEILNIGSSGLGASFFLPYNIRFRQRLHENPITCYGPRTKGQQGTYERKISTKKMTYPIALKFEGKPIKESKRINNQIIELWEQISNPTHKKILAS